jgi:hypothetical protein
VGIAHHRRPSSIVGKRWREGTRLRPGYGATGKSRPYKISPFGKGGHRGILLAGTEGRPYFVILVFLVVKYNGWKNAMRYAI